jgi:hypothetical protein
MSSIGKMLGSLGMTRTAVRFVSALGMTAAVIAGVTLPTVTAEARSAAQLPRTGAQAYFAQSPNRITDTRAGSGFPNAGNRLTGQTITVTVAGGTTGVPVSAGAVVLNVTVANTVGAGFLTVWPTGVPQPSASSLNWAAGETRPNLVTVAVGTGGQVSVFANSPTDVVVDEEGYYGTQVGTAGGYVAVSPMRITDTRAGSGFANAGSTLAAGTRLDVQVTGAGGIPSTGVAAVVLNATVANTTGSSFLTVWPAGGTRPTASNLNWVAGWVVPNRVIVPVSSPGGKVSFFNQFGSTDLVVDVDGYYTDATATGALFTAQSPVRALDTRRDGGTLGPNMFNTYTVAGFAGVPTGASAVVFNTTVTNTTASSFLTVYPNTRPTASDLNWVAGQTIPNMVQATLSSSGTASFYNLAGSTDLILDVFGSFGGASSTVAFQSASAGQTSVKVIFNQPMNNASTGTGATNPANYSVTSPSGSGAQTPTSVSYSTADNSATLTVGTALVPGNTFTVTVPSSSSGISNAGGTGTIPAGTSISGTVTAVAPTITWPTAADCLNTNNPGGGQPRYTGTYPSSGTINIYVDNTSATGTATGVIATGGGAWAFTQPTVLAAGSHTVTATATVGTATSSATTVNFSLSSATPVSPVITSPTNNATTGSKPTITGTGTAGSTIDVVFDGAAAPTSGSNTGSSDGTLNTTSPNGTTTVASNGTWSFTPTTAVPTGAGNPHHVTAYPVLCTLVGTASSATAFNIAAGPATMPTISTSASSAGNNTATINFSDSAETAQSVTIYNVYRANGAAAAFATASVIGTVTANASTSYNFTDTSAVNGSSYTYFVTAANSFGSESPNSAGVTPVTSVPPAVSGVTIAPNPVNAGASVTYSATVSAGSTVDPANVGIPTGSGCASACLVARLRDQFGTQFQAVNLTVAGTNVNAAGYGTYSSASGTLAPAATGTDTDNTLAQDANGNQASGQTTFTVQAASTATSATWLPTSVSLIGTAGSNTSIFIATVKDQYGATMGSGVIVKFSVAPSSSTTGGAVGSSSTTCTTTNGAGQASTTYTGNTKLGATETDTISLTAYTGAGCTGTATALTGTATATVTASPAPTTGTPYMLSAKTLSATQIQLTYNMPVATNGATPWADFTSGVAVATGISGTGSSVLTLTFAAGTFTSATSPGNLSYVGTATNNVASASSLTTLAFTPQDIYTSSGF